MSESPEEQPSTGVLGRIGSWFSPWRGKVPKTPTDNASPTSDPTLKSEGEELSGTQENPNPLPLFRDIFPCEEEDATQSAHRGGSVVSSTGTGGEGGPKEEELVGFRKLRTGQGKEWEESSDSASVSGNPQKNASHLTHFSTSSEQGAVWDSDQAHTQPQAQRRAQAHTGKRLHVYVEETSVIHCGQDAQAGQDIVRTTVTKSLHVLSKAKTPPSLDSPEDKGTNVRPAAGSHSYYSTPDSQLEFESDKEQTEADSMGRKHASRRRSRKNSQGDGGNSPLENMPPNNTQPVPERVPASDESGTSPQGKSPKAALRKAPADSSYELSSTSQASPEGVSETSCPDQVKQLDSLQDSVTVAPRACAVDGAASMEDDDSLYKVERKTETPESKRRSIKVSRSEVKLFTKYVPLNPKQSPAGTSQDSSAAFKKPKADTKDKPTAERDGRVHDPKKADDEPKPGRIADKISIFEGRTQTFRAPRSVDVSPHRKATERLKADFDLSDQRSRSAERHATVRSSSASPARTKLMTIKERASKFAEATVSEAKPTLPQIPAMTGMSQRSSSSVAGATSKSLVLDNQDELDTKAESNVTLKAGGQDATAVEAELSTPKVLLTDSKTKQTAEKGTKPSIVEIAPPAEEPGDSAELSPHLKGPSRTRSKRRKTKEPTSPISPNNQNKPEHSTSKLKVSAIKQEQVDNTGETSSASGQLAEKVSLPSHKVRGNALDKQQLSDTTQKGIKKESEAAEKQKKNLDVAFKKIIDKEEASVGGDEPDTAAFIGETKQSIHKGPVILPQKEEEAERHSLVFTLEGETSASSPSSPAEPSTEKPPAVKQEPSVEQPELDKDFSVQPELKSKGKGSEPSRKETGQNKDTELINPTENVEESEKLEGENQTVQSDKEITQQILPSDESRTVSHSGQGISGKQGSVARDDERRKAERNEGTQPAKDTAKPSQKEPDSDSSDLHVQTQHPEKTAVCTFIETNDAASDSKSDKAAWKVEVATNVPPELQTQSAESPATEPEPAEERPNPVSVEKTEKSLDDSCAHGANDAQLSSSERITKATTAAVEEVSVKVTNNNPLPITTQTNVARKATTESSTGELSHTSKYKSISAVGDGKVEGVRSSADKSVPSEVELVGDVIKLTPVHLPPEEAKNAYSKGDITKPPDAEKVTQRATSSSTETASNLPVNKPPPVSNGSISLNSQVQTVEKEPISNKPSQTPKAPSTPEANKLSTDSIQRPPMRRLHLPRGLGKDDSSKWQDAPSSWLDVDCPKQKLKVQEPKLTSSGSESNLLDTPDIDDDDFITRIKNLCAPFSLPPRKHNHIRPPQPPFAMPAIREDRFEKVFDPEEFTIGLRKKTQFSLDTSQGLLSKLQSTEKKSAIKPARASLADRSMLLCGLDTHSRLRDKTPAEDEKDAREEADDQIKVKSRLEGSCVLSSLTSSSFILKRNGVQPQAEGTGSGTTSPTEAPQISPPPLSQPPPQGLIAPISDSNSKEETRAAEAVVSESGPPLPSFNDMKLPECLEKYLPQDQAKPERSVQGQEQVKVESAGKMSTPVAGGVADVAVKPRPELPDNAAPSIPGIPAKAHPALPELKQPPAQPKAKIRNNVRTVQRGFHKRPGKMVLFEKAQFSGQAYEIYRDVADATSLQLSPLISVKVVRGCWLLYEKPDFQGRNIALEEGGIELANMWAEPEETSKPQDSPPMQIGSIRLAVGDYSIPRIDLFTEPEGRGRVTPYHDDTIETGSFGIPLSTASIQVHSGVWLVCSDPGFEGMIAVLERGVYPFPETWGFPAPFVGSLRPLKMGGFKVENPNEIKAVVYEKPGFEGSCLEIDSDVFSFCEDEGDVATDGPNPDTNKVKSVGSLKITGGFWVGYSLPGFEGQQHILEEGEYLDCSEWGGSELLSLRPVLSDFLSPHMKMFSDIDFGKLGADIDLTVPVINMDDTGYGMKTQSINVISGIWVVFEESGFCGEPYILERGLYGSPEDWGALQHRVGSTMPVLLDDFENTAKFKVQLFSDPGFQGSVLILEDGVASLQNGFSVASCKVLAGNWLAFEGQDFAGKMYVLEEGSYPDLRAMGCVSASASILSLQPTGFEFSLPSITLFERSGLRGKRVVLTDGSVNLLFAGGGGRVQSVLVEGGMWVLYEGINYRGAQILLKPGEVTDWRKFCNWQKIGSLRPLTQKQAHFRLRNRQTGLMMSLTGDLDDVKLLRIQETEETGGFEQIWFYFNGHLHCKLLEECCLSPSSTIVMAGSRVGLTPQPASEDHLWSITPEGFIRYTLTSDLVLEIKGGNHYDKNQVILNTLDPNKLQQRWDVEII